MIRPPLLSLAHLCPFATALAIAGCGGSQSSSDTGVVAAGGTRAVACGAHETVKDHNPSLALRVGELDRSAVVHLPKSYDPAKPTPLLIAFHFAAGSPKLMAMSTQLDDAADTRGFIVAYPAGIGGSWNAGKCCGEAWKKGVDDVQFTRALLDRLESSYCVDKRRIFATGMSNGALMAQRLGCDASDRFAAIAPVAGVLDRESPKALVGLGESCKASPVSVIEFHGTKDSSMPYAGGEGSPPVPLDGDFRFMSVADAVAFWRANASCSGTSRTVYANGDAKCVAWSKCASGAEVELCTIEDGGHTWPGGYMPPVFGKTSRDVDASAAMLSFFEAHPQR